mmetsp:Transcript_141771/g.440775  ORF Transcript_141771/g.440775 Transcript_141771/m.440775 type:complete len:221 (-) Transcript_141771:379-1041(-)
MCRKCSKNLAATLSYTGLCMASSMAMRMRLRLKKAIQLVPSDWLMKPPVGSSPPRSKTPMLSRPRKPPWKMLRPSASLRLTHQVKFIMSLWKTSSKKPRSPLSFRCRRSIWNTRQDAHACTGGLTSLKFHSKAGSWPFGCMYHSRVISRSWPLAKLASTSARGMQWKARSQVAYHGNSHLSGIEMMSLLHMWSQSLLRMARRASGGLEQAGSPSKKVWMS